MEQWLATHSELDYSPEAIEFAGKVMRQEFSARKRQKFRSSSTGMCARKRIYSALGIHDRGGVDSKLSNIFFTGNYLHLKWQMAGLTEGWLTEAEVARDNPDINFGGTLDGILWDGSGFEFKTINSRGYQFVMQKPKDMHVYQVHAYMYLDKSIDKFSIVYENKDTGDWREYRVQKDPELIKKIDREVGALNQALEQRKLPPVLPDCAKREGTVYRQCPFKDFCPTMKKWPAVVNGKVVGQ